MDIIGQNGRASEQPKPQPMKMKPIWFVLRAHIAGRGNDKTINIQLQGATPCVSKEAAEQVQETFPFPTVITKMGADLSTLNEGQRVIIPQLRIPEILKTHGGGNGRGHGG